LNKGTILRLLHSTLLSNNYTSPKPRTSKTDDGISIHRLLPAYLPTAESLG